MADIRERLRLNIERVIESSTLSKSEIAEHLEVSPAAITNWIKGRNSPDLEKLIRFCELFDLSLNDIYGSDTIAVNRDPERDRLFKIYESLNFTGKMKLVDLADDLAASGKYKPYGGKRK